MVKLKPHKGITSLGFLCEEGVILASCSPLNTGRSNVIEIDRYMLSTMVGEPADKLFWKQGPVLFCIDEEVGFTHCYSHAVRSGSSFAENTMGAGFHCHMIADEAALFARLAIRRAALQDGVVDGVATVYYGGPHGWELISCDEAGNPGPHDPVSMNSVDQEMTEDQEPTEEDTKWSSYLELVEWGRGIDQTLFRVCKS